MTGTSFLVEPADWDAFVEANELGSYLQRTAWARVKAVNGWSSARVVAGGAAPIGAQVLLRRPRPLPWSFAYAPRGPVASSWNAESVADFTTALRSGLPGRVSHVRIDPEIERDGPLDPAGSLRAILAGAVNRKRLFGDGLPGPEAPRDQIAVPPFVTGNMQSKTRCPVMSGWTGSTSFERGGGSRTGQVCIRVSSYCVIECTDNFIDPEFACTDIRDLPGYLRGNEDPVLELELRDSPDDVPGA